MAAKGTEVIVIVELKRGTQRLHRSIEVISGELQPRTCSTHDPQKATSNLTVVINYRFYKILKMSVVSSRWKHFIHNDEGFVAHSSPEFLSVENEEDDQGLASGSQSA